MRIFQSSWVRAALIILCLSVLAAVFELLPTIKDARAHVSPENYQNLETSCQKILADRPWFGKFNHWFFAWIVLIPTLIFSMSPKTIAWRRNTQIIFSVIAGYVLINLAASLQWAIRNAPFQQDPFHPDPMNNWRTDCIHNAGDGFSGIFTLAFGWLPVCVYVGLSMIAWLYYHQKFSKKNN